MEIQKSVLPPENTPLERGKMNLYVTSCIQHILESFNVTWNERKAIYFLLGHDVEAQGNAAFSIPTSTLQRISFVPNLAMTTGMNGGMLTSWPLDILQTGTFSEVLVWVSKNWSIKIDSGLSKRDAVLTLYHELTHLIFDFLAVLRKFENSKAISADAFTEFVKSDFFTVQTEYFAHFFTANASYSFLKPEERDQNYVFEQAGIHLPGDIAYKTACLHSSNIRAHFNLLYNYLLGKHGREANAENSYQALPAKAQMLLDKIGHAHTAAAFDAESEKDFQGLESLLFDANRCLDQNDKITVLRAPTVIDSPRTTLFRTTRAYRAFVTTLLG